MTVLQNRRIVVTDFSLAGVKQKVSFRHYISLKCHARVGGRTALS
jgi:hypothetical protein